ncbi:response regulator transcription factor [Propionivibrio dicarboxylicus]|uniref:DNA-binding response regulator, NarL/FixJ family, contains REC and HTH domains n=1 Tax=Propionivibrio dicarboxylicus TaxID=83767 RepID=A0A1G7VL50_9RHOO|nr:DNA-binding response regulator [Propionivibrio dicarboxylicus]SDG60572.1 DNA-binding response regulator, NarL/FixJ family, contains REC and HTH domains [Propionivibrio dicarboxylicus]
MSNSAKATVLLIDDELVNIKILSDVLKDDYVVIFASGGEEGVRRASESMPDIILLDIMMPDMDGYAVCARLQENRKTSSIPVVYVTALGSTAQEIKGLNLGAVDYITKPINEEIVKARIRNHLKFRRVVQAASRDDAVEEDSRQENMTERQREIFRWVREGKTNWEIAKIIGCSEENVKYHMKNILRIMGSYNRTQAVATHVRKRAPKD